MNQTTTSCIQELDGLERVNFFPRQLLTADDLKQEQTYFREKLRRHNRFLHGWGVVCGLEVKAAPTEGMPWRVRIEAGYALAPQGDDICLPQAVFLDLAQCGPGAVTDPCDPGLLHAGTSAAGETFYVAIKYAECVARPVRAVPAGCGCDEEACEYSRIRDSFEIECLTELPPDPPDLASLCEMIDEGQLPACPPCPPDPWVVLARVTPEVGRPLEDRFIDNTIRCQLFSTAVLQEQLIKCCCERRPESELLEVESVDFLAIDPDGSHPVTTLGGQPPLQAKFQRSEEVNAIRATFSLPVQPDTVTTKSSENDPGSEFSFQVERLGLQNQREAVAGTLTVSDRTVLFKKTLRFFEAGVYEVILRGTATDSAPAITSDNAIPLPLDGEPNGLPSGDGTPGGDFHFEFTSIAPGPID